MEERKVGFAMKDSPLKAKRTAGYLIALALLFGVIAILTQVHFFLFILLGLLIASAVVLWKFWRCPHCGKRLPWQSERDVDTCEKCGGKLK